LHYAAIEAAWTLLLHDGRRICESANETKQNREASPENDVCYYVACVSCLEACYYRSLLLGDLFLAWKLATTSFLLFHAAAISFMSRAILAWKLATMTFFCGRPCPESHVLDQKKETKNVLLLAGSLRTRGLQRAE
jgi:hypothetical protein